MELTIKRADLAAELGRFQSIIERKNTLPVLANILVEADAGLIGFSATDLDVTLVSSIAGTTGAAGKATLPARKLFEIVKALPEGDVRIEADGAQAKVSSASYGARLQTLPHEDFPQMPVVPGKSPVQLPAAKLSELIRRVQFAVTGEDTRYYLNGALLELRPDGVLMVATDGHRMAMASWAMPLTGSGEKVILPAKGLGELARQLDGSAADALVTFEHGENHLFFIIAGRMLATRMIDGTFPAYERVIPKNNDKQVVVDHAPFTQALRRVSIVTAERTRAVKLAFTAGCSVITATSPEYGDAREELPADYAGADVTVMVNARYLLDFLDVVSADKLSLLLKDEVSQILVRPVGDEPVDYTYVVMPMRT